MQITPVMCLYYGIRRLTFIFEIVVPKNFSSSPLIESGIVESFRFRSRTIALRSHLELLQLEQLNLGSLKRVIVRFPQSLHWKNRFTASIIFKECFSVLHRSAAENAVYLQSLHKIALQDIVNVFSIFSSIASFFSNLIKYLSSSCFWRTFTKSLWVVPVSKISDICKSWISSLFWRLWFSVALSTSKARFLPPIVPRIELGLTFSMGHFFNTSKAVSLAFWCGSVPIYFNDFIFENYYL